MFSQRSRGLRWRKSSYSSSSGPDCVELAYVPDMIAVRDSKDPDGPVLGFRPATFAAFLKHTKENH